MNTRLLIVDDHAHTRELIRKFLTLPGIIIQECVSGEDAIARAKEFNPDWVTMDVEMPGLDGFESTKALKQACPRARVMIVTSFNEPQFRQRAHSVGATGYILKENILALRVMLESEARNIQPPVAIPGGIAPSVR